MIFIYAYMLNPSQSYFNDTTLNIYLKELYKYFNNSNYQIKNFSKLKLGGDINSSNPLSHRIQINNNPVPNTPSPPIAPSPPTAPISTNNNPLSHRIQIDNTPVQNIPSPPSAPISTNIQPPTTSYYGQFKNYINDKLNQELSIDNKQNIPIYYANPNLSYYIVVDLELFPGDKISFIDKRNLSCQIRFDNIRKSYANLLGYSYQPSLLNTSVIPTKINNRTVKSNPTNNNNTKKISNNNNVKKNTNNTEKNRNNSTNNSTRKYRA